MITQRQPEHWRELQSEVARILDECGIQSEVEKTVTLARGTAEVDVYAAEANQGRENIIFCECKLWKSSVPKNVIHGFRTVVAEGGANIGYIITSSNFQRGATTAADLTNLRLLTWTEFQAEFESTWIDHHLRPEVTKRLDFLLSIIEPFAPVAFEKLDETEKANFLQLREKYFDLGATVMMFTTYGKMIHSELPDLPLRNRWEPSSNMTEMWANLLDATAYGDFLEILLPFGEKAIAELKAALHPKEAREI
ncbi:restriction endonuclease [Arthrobacter frigidicola]|nr:restriction endonuclease [Arthrobacter frigidicola]